MAVDRDEEDRRIGPDEVEILLAWPAGRKGIVAPAEAADDVGLAELGAIPLQGLQHLFPAIELEIDASGYYGAGHGVDVPLHEARQQHLPAKIHDAGSRPDERADPGVVADIDDVLLPNGDRACPFAATADGVDRAVVEDDIGLAVRRIGRRRHRNGGGAGGGEDHARLQDLASQWIVIG